MKHPSYKFLKCATEFTWWTVVPLNENVAKYVNNCHMELYWKLENLVKHGSMGPMLTLSRFYKFIV